MRGAVDIDLVGLALGYLILLPAFLVLFYFRTGLLGSSLLAIVRMTVQLLLIGFYLKYIFLLDSSPVNILWLLVMMAIASGTIIRRSDLSVARFVLPVFLGLMIGILFVGVPVLTLVLRLPRPLTAPYLIPIGGMVLGNCLGGSIIGLRGYYQGLQNFEAEYRHHLGCGATVSEARQPYLRNALQSAYAPTIATMATMGLVSLPGMMTGQILGGSSPLTAVKYQILIMIAIFTGTVLSVVAGILFSARLAFDPLGLLKRDPTHPARHKWLRKFRKRTNP